MSDPTITPRALAAIDMIRRTGCHQFQIRYSGDNDEQPVVWIAVAGHRLDRRGRPVPPDLDKIGREHWTVAAGITPEAAVLALAETLVDGGTCAHCSRPSGLDPDGELSSTSTDPICWTAWDPELSTFRRGCQGDPQ